MEEIYSRAALAELAKINMLLTEKLETLLNLRVEHAKLQRDVAKLYTSECIEILNECKEVLRNVDDGDTV